MEEAEAKRRRRENCVATWWRLEERRARSPTTEAAAMEQFLNEMYAEHGPRLEAMAANAASAARHNGNVENGKTATAKRTHEEMGVERDAAEGGGEADRARAAEAGAEESMEMDGAAAADDRRAEHSDDEEEEETAPAAKKKKGKKRGKRANSSARIRAKRRGDGEDSIPETRNGRIARH